MAQESLQLVGATAMQQNSQRGTKGMDLSAAQVLLQNLALVSTTLQEAVPPAREQVDSDTDLAAQ